MTDPAHPADVTLVERPQDLRALAADLAVRDLVALDVEANSLHAYRERVCVVQVTAGDRHAIVDAVALEDLSPLGDALDRDTVEVVFHGGDYDIATLSRDHAFRFHRVFDTMIAATLLGEEKVGLADLVRDAYGVELDKRFQRADWGRRPFTDEQIDYLVRDTAYLPGLRERLRARLAEADLLEEADVEFRRLAQRVGKPVGFDPEGWRGLKGAAKLDARGRAVLEALHRWREAEAERRDVPPFKVLAPAAMLAIAREPPEGARDPRDLRALHPRDRRRYGPAVLEAVTRALARARDGQAPEPDRRPRRTAAEIAAHKRERRIEEALRAWRRREAEARKVPNLVVLPNRALAWLTRERPRTLEHLAACEDVGPGRVARYGEAVLEVIRKSDGDART